MPIPDGPDREVERDANSLATSSREGVRLGRAFFLNGRNEHSSRTRVWLRYSFDEMAELAMPMLVLSTHSKYAGDYRTRDLESRCSCRPGSVIP